MKGILLAFFNDWGIICSRNKSDWEIEMTSKVSKLLVAAALAASLGACMLPPSMVNAIDGGRTDNMQRTFGCANPNDPDPDCQAYRATHPPVR